MNFEGSRAAVTAVFSPAHYKPLPCSELSLLMLTDRYFTREVSRSVLRQGLRQYQMCNKSSMCMPFGMTATWFRISNMCRKGPTLPHPSQPIPTQPSPHLTCLCSIRMAWAAQRREPYRRYMQWRVSCRRVRCGGASWVGRPRAGTSSSPHPR